MKASTSIRHEQLSDIDAIEILTTAAFLDMPYSSHTEQFIVNALRKTGRLTLSLVAVENGDIIGHIAISPISISATASGWFGLGPLSVTPARQREGIGRELVKEALAHLKRDGAAGCVVLGDPGYYGRFGFRPESALTLPGVPAEYFQALAFSEKVPAGTVSFDEAFDARA
ncbi:MULTISPECIES: N-acetyltransferase [unclassified Caballeronia]|uniref:GNAT family N-acetyltransferase n=1 Tax=unclassified Caballeronia TaxID=2646786 RepID=UPI002029848A|nr:MULTISPECIES: N-acetyltransferase [unclassified Caballeronia]